MIKEINIQSFGAINDLHLEFDNGLNVIYGENEAGKSTIIAFIKAMLFGFDTSNARKLVLEEKLSYKPWNSSTYAGNLLFVDSSNNEYLISRSFNTSNNKDELIVTNNLTGSNVSLYSHKFGQIIFDLSLETFCTTAYFGQNNIGLKNNDELIKKMSNILTTGKEDVNFNHSIKMIDDKRGYYYRGKTGLINKQEARLNELLTMEENNNKDYQDLLYKMEKLKYVNEKIDKLKLNQYKYAQKQEYIKYDKDSKIYLNIEMLKFEILQLKMHITKIEKSLFIDNFIFDNNFMKSIDIIHNNLLTCKTKIEHLENDISTLGFTNYDTDLKNKYKLMIESNNKIASIKENINLNRHELAELRQKYHDLELDYSEHKKINNIKVNESILLLLAFLSVIIGVTISFLNIDNMIKFICVPIIVVGFILVYFLLSSSKRKLMKKYHLSKKELINKASNELNISTTYRNVIDTYKTYTDQIEVIQRDLDDKLNGDSKERVMLNYQNQMEDFATYQANKKIYDEKTNIINTLTNDYNKLLEDFNKELAKLNYKYEDEASYISFIDKINNDLLEYQKYKDNYNFKSDLLNSTLNQNDYEKLKESHLKLLAIDKELINEEYEDLQEDLQNLIVEKSNIELLIEQYHNQETINNDIKYEIEQLKNDIKDNYFILEAIDIAKQSLLESFEAISNDISPKLSSYVSKHLNELTNGKYQRVLIDSNYNIKVVEKNNNIYQLSSYSKGTIDQVYISIRLALINIIAEKESVPILFDDSFNYFDDTRLKNTLLYLSNITDNQLLLFTCQNRENNLLNCNYKYIVL